MKVLVLGLTESFGGLEKIILELFSRIGNNIKIDFGFSCSKPDYFLQYESYGFTYIKIPKLNSPINYYNDIKKICKKNNYDIAYCNLAFSNILLLLALRSGGVQKIIFHSHNTKIDAESFCKRLVLTIYHYISRPLSNILLWKKLACSALAYKWLFTEIPNNTAIIHNAINLDEYIYDAKIAAKIKKQMFNSEDVIVFGNVGRFSYQKNQHFLLDIFSEIVKNNSNARLLLVGDGELRETIEEKILEMGLQEKVICTGFKKNAKIYYQAMDCFVLPSRFEGLPLVGIEAQASGLPCFFSDTITKELEITELCHFIGLEKSPKEWAEVILKNSLIERCDMSKELSEAGYDMAFESRRFQKILNN